MFLSSPKLARCLILSRFVLNLEVLLLTLQRRIHQILSFFTNVVDMMRNSECHHHHPTLLRLEDLQEYFQYPIC